MYSVLDKPLYISLVMMLRSLADIRNGNMASSLMCSIGLV